MDTCSHSHFNSVVFYQGNWKGHWNHTAFLLVHDREHCNCFTLSMDLVIADHFHSCFGLWVCNSNQCIKIKVQPSLHLCRVWVQQPIAMGFAVAFINCVLGLINHKRSTWVFLSNEGNIMELWGSWLYSFGTVLYEGYYLSSWNNYFWLVDHLYIQGHDNSARVHDI